LIGVSPLHIDLIRGFAYEVMIGIKSNIGPIALAIRGDVREGMADALMQLGVASLVYRAGGSKVFSAKSGFKRDAQFSEELANFSVASCNEVLGAYLNNIRIEPSLRVKAEPKVGNEKAREQMRLSLAGLMTSEQIEAAVEQAFPSKKVEAAKAELELLDGEGVD
jgi:hypothetical protein